jgi:hypothetical protein
MVPGAGESDAEGVEATDERMYGDSGVLFPAVVGVSPIFLKRFGSE